MQILNKLFSSTIATDSRATGIVPRTWRDHKFFLATLLLVIACSLSLAPAANAKYNDDDDKKSEKRDSKSSKKDSKESRKSDKDSKKDKDRKHSKDDDDKGKGHHDDDDDDDGKGKGHHDDDDDDHDKGKGHHDDDDDDDGHKVEICHFPKGNPGNSHTIRVSEKSLPAHYAHGDYAGACDDAIPCPSGDLCTDWAYIDGECVAVPLVDCGDTNACTTDMCVPSTGQCQSAPIICPEVECRQTVACTVIDQDNYYCDPQGGRPDPNQEGEPCSIGVCSNGICVEE